MRTPFDIVFNALLTMGLTQSVLGKIHVFINMVITRVKNRSPDMIPVAFEGNFDEKKDEIPPGIYRPHIVDFF